MYTLGKEIFYRVETLSRNTDVVFDDFSCGNDIIDRYLKIDALDDTKNITYLFIDNSDNSVTAFASLSCSGIRYHISEATDMLLPSIEISFFAVRNDLQGLMYDEYEDDVYHFSDQIFAEIIKICRDISEKYIGAEYINLYAVPDAVHFYERNFFESYSEYMKASQKRFLDGCQPMYFSLLNN
ncbi:MAG: hypothetical protein LIO53_06960 [Oscillospiraceae bacterium]|nr:hypothetical protein [Oscillospiraceae bacterium]